MRLLYPNTVQYSYINPSISMRYAVLVRYRRIYGDLNLSNRLTSESAQTQRKCMGENWHTAKYSVLTGLYLAKRAHGEGNYETRAKFVTEFKSPYKMYGSDITMSSATPSSKRRCITDARAQAEEDAPT